MASMSTIFLTKRTACINISKVKSLSSHRYSRTASTASFSSAYERAEGNNAVAEANNDDIDVRDSPAKAVEMSDNVGDTAKETMDGKWRAAKETTQKVKEAVTGGGEYNKEVEEGPFNVESLKETET
ncbi:hypothetical protein O6P43_000983 [Quillaja saponaria]|uniref:Uncharacterized protein n=1 Tax=Quillaja saponaria TaxID=32244 RepID=A0AAD7QHS4_QUISA|nr:hypothetical protein O6P43_000983 [Quillaja saponaria]